MKIIKISAVWCSSCLVMQKVWESVKQEFPKLEWKDLDVDFDPESQEYQVGNMLPVLILENENKEINRLVGEKTKEEVVEWLKQNSTF